MAYKLRRQSNNTSGLVGLRLRHRFTRTGLRRYFIEVSWQGRRGRRMGTSFPVAPDNFMFNTARAMVKHMTSTGVNQGFEPDRVWAMLVRGYKKANRRG